MAASDVEISKLLSGIDRYNTKELDKLVTFFKKTVRCTPFTTINPPRPRRTHITLMSTLQSSSCKTFPILKSSNWPQATNFSLKSMIWKQRRAFCLSLCLLSPVMTSHWYKITYYSSLTSLSACICSLKKNSLTPESLSCGNWIACSRLAYLLNFG